MPDETEQHRVLARHGTRTPLGGVTMAGFIRHSHGLPAHSLRTLPSYGCVYVLDGGGHYRDASGRGLPVRAGDLLLLFPELPHTYGPDATSHWSELYALFDGPVFDLWRRTGLLDPAHPIHHLEPIELWAQRFHAAIAAPVQPGAGPALSQVCQLQSVLADAVLGPSTPARSDEAAWVARACALLETGHADGDLRAIADDLGMSYDGFRKRFTKALGVPPARYRTVRAIDRACELMQQGGLTDREIAEHLGFCDEFYFSRRFKQVTGRAPREFRASLPRTR